MLSQLFACFTPARAVPIETEESLLKDLRQAVIDRNYSVVDRSLARLDALGKLSEA